jgi:surface antigen
MRWCTALAAALLVALSPPASATLGNDDYPYRDAAVDRTDPWGFLTRECTSFVAWRVQHDLGVRDFGNHYRGGRFGDARDWAANARRIGLWVDETPAKQTIAVFAPGVEGAGGYGHVAMVLSVGAGTVTVEDYNYQDAWNDDRPYRYSQHTVAVRRLSFIHVAQADRSVPIRGNGAVENTTSTATSKYSAILNARKRLGLYSPRSR